MGREAPRALEGVTASGTPLAELSSVSIDGPLDLTWGVDGPGDTVYVELLSTRSSNRSICAFSDALGAGSVPTESFESGDSGRVVVHRLRTHAFEASDGDLARGHLRFDFALTANVAFE